MATQFGDGRARRVCLDLASIILHQTARNHLGLVGHDDHAEFAIPDTCYFAVRALMSAWKLDPGNGAAFLEHAASQLRAYTDTFLAKETGLAKTILHREGLGKTYWTRASGWLLLAITSVLRHLPQSHPSRQGFLTDLRNLVDGMVRVQDPSGGFHVFLDDPAAPLETTGALMFATAAHEAVRMSWLSPSYLAAAQRAWAFAQGNVSGDGWLLNVYTGWAVPAEKRQILMDRRDTGFPAGFLLCAANEMTLPVGR